MKVSYSKEVLRKTGQFENARTGMSVELTDEEVKDMGGFGAARDWARKHVNQAILDEIVGAEIGNSDRRRKATEERVAKQYGLDFD